MEMVIALGAEIWSGQQRVKIIEKRLATEGKVTPEMIEQYVATGYNGNNYSIDDVVLTDDILGDFVFDFVKIVDELLGFRFDIQCCSGFVHFVSAFFSLILISLIELK